MTISSRTKFTILMSFTLLTMLSNSANSTECQAKSTTQTVPLLELYTSEGCSSCPPADQWLSLLKTEGKVTPLAFHVDYWDYIGWRDVYAKPEFSTRQRSAAAIGGASFVYTPQFTLNGRDYKGTNNSQLKLSIDKISKSPARANLSLVLTPQNNGDFVLSAKAEASKPRSKNEAQVFIAIYQNKLSSQVKAGENNGRELKHDYVVREFFGGYPLNESFAKSITLKPEWKNKDAGAVIFVQDSKTGETWQSLQLVLCTS